MAEITLTGDNFLEEVLNHKGIVLVDFWADWCGPCKMIAPIVHNIAVKHSGSVKVGKVNIDEQPELAENYQITNIPTLMAFKDGKPLNQVVGYVDAITIESMWQ